MGRCLLIQAKLPKSYWVRALATAVHIRNLTVSINSNQNRSPFELFTGKAPRRNHLRVFGCTAYVRKRKINLRKLDSRSVEAKFLGYDDKSTAYILQEFSTKKIIKARRPKESFLESPNIDLDNERSNDQTTEKPVEDKVGENREVIPNTHDQLEDEEETSIPRANRNRRPPERYGNPFTFKTTQEETVTEPKTYKDAVSSTQAKYWKQAINASRIRIA
jgi:hypothetical protein